MKPVRKAILPVGGLGTRLLPATKAVPKEMLTIVDKPLIQYAVEEAAEAGIETMVFVIGPGKEAIQEHFDEMPDLQGTLKDRGKGEALEAVQEAALNAGECIFVRQPEALGVGHAVWCARHLVEDEAFAVLLPDDLILSPVPCLKQLLDARAGTGGNVIAVEDVPREATASYGIVDIAAEDGGGGGQGVVAVKGLVEKPDPEQAPSTLAVIGRYVLEPEVMAALEHQEPGAGGEVQLTDAIAATIGQVPLHAVPFRGRRFDCGKMLGLVEANIEFALARESLKADMAALLDRYRRG